MSGLSWLLVCGAGSQIKAADAPAVVPVDQAVIYFSFAPWYGAAYDIEVPLEHADDGVQPVIRINIWGYPQFSEPKTIHFSGKEDDGGGLSRGDGRPLFQANLNKTMPERWWVRFRLGPFRITTRFQEFMNSQPWMGKGSSRAVFRLPGVIVRRRSSGDMFLRAM